jgi:hypothetical protein
MHFYVLNSSQPGKLTPEQTCPAGKQQSLRRRGLGRLTRRIPEHTSCRQRTAKDLHVQRTSECKAQTQEAHGRGWGL